ncbi:hypothetical protein Pcinc_007360 [Petrolisthes cinctipes]|uniref:Uncharacterized protein n=1 Tax=Petrolisthes cinctipes TaxID=88211 RepID=A0AAE1GB48_PETCI|nr:hypothetical protein Pcinc_007360 [Petrolisthes cinctipes]
MEVLFREIVRLYFTMTIRNSNVFLFRPVPRPTNPVLPPAASSAKGTSHLHTEMTAPSIISVTLNKVWLRGPAQTTTTHSGTVHNARMMKATAVTHAWRTALRDSQT